MSQVHGGPASLSQLRAFERVAATGSFSAAALDLWVAQSSVSRGIDRLEQSLGATLLDRSPRGATLTSAGQAILGDVRHALALLDGLPGAVAGTELRGGVSVGAFRSATEQILPTVLADVHAAHPGIALRVQAITEIDGAIGRAVATGAVDIGITSLPAPGDLIVVPLFEDPYVRVEPITAAPAELTFILWKEDCSRKAVAWLERAGDSPHASLELDDDRAVLAHISKGLGYSLMPALSTASTAANVRTVGLADGPTRRVAVCTTTAALGRADVHAVFEAIKTNDGQLA